MSSLIMHLCVAEIITKKFNYSDKFFLGEIMPDIIKMGGVIKSKSHYRTFMNKRPIYNIGLYIQEHKSLDEYNLGDIAHLLQDEYINDFCSIDVLSESEQVIEAR